MIAGTIIWRRFWSGASKKRAYSSSGAQRHHTDGNTITSVPSQNPGTASMRIENERVT